MCRKPSRWWRVVLEIEEVEILEMHSLCWNPVQSDVWSTAVTLADDVWRRNRCEAASWILEELTANEVLLRGVCCCLQKPRWGLSWRSPLGTLVLLKTLTSMGPSPKPRVPFMISICGKLIWGYLIEGRVSTKWLIELDIQTDKCCARARDYNMDDWTN